MVHEH